MNAVSGNISARSIVKANDTALHLVISVLENGVAECALLTPGSSSAKHRLSLTLQEGAVQQQYVVDVAHISSLQLEILSPSSLTVSDLEFDRALREIVQYSVARYYKEHHKPTQVQPFTSGARIPYAGRVFDGEEMRALTESTLDFWLTSGRFTEQFEREFASYMGARFAALVNSGSSANLLAFATLTSPLLKEDQVVPGDEVITVAAGFPTTVAPIIQNGCVPVFLDVTVDDGTYNIDVSQLEEALSSRTKVVMLAHTLGNPFNLEVIDAFCKKHNLWLIEDNCDALGSIYNGKLTGTFGDLATSSFYPPHHLTMGEGGAVYSSSVKLKKIVESFRDWGRDCWCAAGKDNTCGTRFGFQLGSLPLGYDHKYIYRHLGYNLKASDMQASIGCVQLTKLPKFVEARKQNWKMLREGLAELSDIFVLPQATPNSDPSWFGFALTIRDEAGISRNELVKHLESKNIQTRMLFAGNIIRHPLFDDFEKTGRKYRTVGDLKQSDRVLENTFWLGVYPGLKLGMLEHVINEIRGFVGR